MRFPELLRTTVLLCAAAATVLAVRHGRRRQRERQRAARSPSIAGWWVLAALSGVSIGRRHDDLASDRECCWRARGRRRSLPEINPGRIVLNRLWPIILCTIGAGAVAFAYPQVPGDRGRLRDHLGARLAPSVGRGDRDRGARRRPLLRRAHLAAAADQAGPHARIPLQPDRDGRRQATRRRSPGATPEIAMPDGMPRPMNPLAYIPSPSEQRLLDRAAVLPRLRDLLRVRRRRRDLHRAPPLGEARRRPGHRLRRRLVGLPGRPGRRPDLLPDHHAEPDSRSLVGPVRDLGRRPRNLGRHRRRRRRSGSGTCAGGDLELARRSIASWTPPRRGCWSRSRSAGSATTSTRSCSASPRRCRGR